jgi:hypothetical protein
VTTFSAQLPADTAPVIFPAHVIVNDSEVLHADFAAYARRDAALRDRERRLPWAERERFTTSGLGAITSLSEHGVDRHWPNARVHTLHDPVRWKYHSVHLNQQLPWRKGYL